MSYSDDTVQAMKQFGMTPATSPEDKKFLEDCSSLQDLQGNLDSIKKKIDKLTDDICACLPIEIGDVYKTVEGVTVTVTRPERFKWDQDLIKQLLNDVDVLPSHVTKRYTVEKRRFERLPDEDKALLMPALTREAGAPKITVDDLSV
tara:strand:+ start:5942 stop:6382 length:441 start_codon:yes stop_codon:yes gene_type:complete